MKQPIAFRSALRTQLGFTLTEIAIVSGVIGLILGAVWTAASSVIQTNRANQAAEDIATIANNMRATFTAINSFSSSGDQTASLITEGGIFPIGLLNGNPPTSLIDAWGGAVTLTEQPAGVQSPYSASRVFRITYNNTPEDACMRIASQLANVGTSDAPIEMIVAGGSAVVVPNVNTNSNGTLGLPMTTIKNACAADGTGGTNASLAFDFLIH